MPYKKLIKIYSERKNKLNDLLDDKNLGLNHERINAINGAIDEIGLFLTVLNQYQEQALTTVQEQRAEETQVQKSLFGRIRNTVMGYIL